MNSTGTIKTQLATREKLYTTTPCRSTRYDSPQTDKSLRELELPYATHLSTRCSAPAYIGSLGWQTYVHPEGKRYYARSLAPRVISEVDLTNNAVSNVVDAWVDLILEWAAELDLELGPSVELFVEPEIDTGICDYYFADHNSRAIFWLENASTSELGLPSVCSGQHLKLALEENFWRHVEMFGLHLEDLPAGALEELIAIYLHGRADLATSSTSTFYFTPEVTDVHLNILMNCRSMPRNPIIFAFVARLWAYMANARFQNFYGEEHCRLDRTIHVFTHEEQRPSFIWRCIFAAMFGLPEEVRSQLNEQLVDGLVIERVWSAFIVGQTAEWQTMMQWMFALIISSALALPVSPIPVISHISLVLSTAALLVAVLLQQHFKRLSKDVDDVCALLESQNNNMAPLAIVFSLPRAAFIWGLVFFAFQASCILFCAIPFTFGVVTGIALLAFALGIWKVLNPSHSFFHTPALPRMSLLPMFHRGQKVEDVESRI